MDQTVNGVELSVSRGSANYFPTEELFRIQIHRPFPGSLSPIFLGILMYLNFSKVSQVTG